MDPITEIKNLAKENKLILGSKKILKLLKNGKLNKLYLASNCKEDVKEDILRYAKFLKVEVIELKQKNIEIGALCKKPFSISVLGY